MRPTGQIPFSLQSVNRQRLTDGYVPPAISGQWLIDELGCICAILYLFCTHLVIAN